MVKFVYESVGCPCLPPTGLTQFLVGYLHGGFAHLFAFQAEAERDMLTRREVRSVLLKLSLLPCHFLLVPAAGGNAEGEARPADNPLPSHSHEGI